jgi:hypothetical protein
MAKKKKYTITKEQQRLNERKINREIELEKNGSWTQVHKVHPSKKTYNRNNNPKIDPNEL